MKLFGKTKKSDKTLQFLKIINKLEDLQIGDSEKLADIKLDLEEGIPITLKKQEYLTKMINELKEHVKLNKSQEQTNKNQKQNHAEITTTKNSEKDSKNQNNKLLTLLKKKPKNENRQKQDSNNEGKKNFFSSLFSRKKIKESKETQNNDKQKIIDLDKKILQKESEQTNLQIVENSQQKSNDYPSQSLEHPASEDPSVPESEYVSKNEFYDENNHKFQSMKEMELKEIKRLINQVEEEKKKLSEDVDKIKSNYNYSKFISRYEEIQNTLDSASSGLYSVQSVVYTRLREIRKLKKELIILRDDIESVFSKNPRFSNNLSSNEDLK